MENADAYVLPSWNAGLVVARDLTGSEDEAAEGDGLGVVCERPRGCQT